MQTMTRAGAPPAPLSGLAVLKSHRALLITQGVYYLLTGLWAIVDIDSFQAVTGPKTDLWLVRTVAVLIVAISAVLLLAARRTEASAEVTLLAVGSAVGLAAIDVIYVTAGVISPIYLLDAVGEVVLLAWWGACLLSRDHDSPARR